MIPHKNIAIVYKKEEKRIIDEFILFLLGLYFTLSPIYLWRSGVPQVADFILAITIILYVMKSKFIFKYTKVSYSVILISITFLIWIIMVNLLWTVIIQSSDSFLTNTIFYLYNTMVFVFTIIFLTEYKRRLLKIIYIGIFISILIQVISIFYNGGFNGGRMVGTFNNPNQLGYYSILSSALIIVIADKVQLSNKVFVSIMLLSFGLVLVSLSNAAIIAWFLQLSAFIILRATNKKNHGKKITIIGILLLLLLIATNSTIISNSDLYMAVESRLMKTEEKIANLSTDRGYNRIEEYPEYWVFGSGEGAYYRFSGYGGEFHSTIGNIQVSYGLIGTMIFFSLLFSVIKNSKFKYMFIIFSVLLYGYSHNGIRNSLFWILLAIISSCSELNRCNEKLE